MELVIGRSDQRTALRELDSVSCYIIDPVIQKKKLSCVSGVLIIIRKNNPFCMV